MNKCKTFLFLTVKYSDMVRISSTKVIAFITQQETSLLVPAA